MEMIKVGPAGRGGGSIWEENGRSEVAGIFVSYTKTTIQSLQFLFYENGNFVQSNKHGSNSSENFCAVVLDYPSEFLTSLSGFYVNETTKVNTNKFPVVSYGPSGYTSYVGDGYSTGLETIKFNTNKGSYGPYGCTMPTSHSKHFNFQLGNHSLFGGFHGTMSPFSVESIGIYVKPIISSMINLKDLRVKDENEEN